MMEDVNLTDLNKKYPNRFLLAVAVAKRARQLKEGATPLVELKDGEMLPIMTAIDDTNIQYKYNDIDYEELLSDEISNTEIDDRDVDVQWSDVSISEICSVEDCKEDEEELIEEINQYLVTTEIEDEVVEEEEKPKKDTKSKSKSKSLAA